VKVDGKRLFGGSVECYGRKGLKSCDEAGGLDELVVCVQSSVKILPEDV